MKSLTYAVLCLAALIGSALAHFHLPKGDLELKAHPTPRSRLQSLLSCAMKP